MKVTATKYQVRKRERFLLKSLEDEGFFSTCREAFSVEFSVGRKVTERETPDAALQGQVSL